MKIGSGQRRLAVWTVGGSSVGPSVVCVLVVQKARMGGGVDDNSLMFVNREDGVVLALGDTSAPWGNACMVFANDHDFEMMAPEMSAPLNIRQMVESLVLPISLGNKTASMGGMVPLAGDGGDKCGHVTHMVDVKNVAEDASDSETEPLENVNGCLKPGGPGTPNYYSSPKCMAMGGNGGLSCVVDQTWGNSMPEGLTRGPSGASCVNGIG